MANPWGGIEKNFALQPFNLKDIRADYLPVHLARRSRFVPYLRVEALLFADSQIVK